MKKPKASKRTAVNLITNGDFSAGAEGWASNTGGEVRVVDGLLLLSAANQHSAMQIVKGLSPSENYKLTFSYRVRRKGVNDGYVLVNGKRIDSLETVSDGETFVKSVDHQVTGVTIKVESCGITDLDQAYVTLQPLLGQAAATIFGLSLVAAGLSSTVVGTLAGQVVMQGFVRFYIPLWVRRVVTMLPSFIVIMLGMDATRILVLSQVLLSFGIALALVPLLSFTGNRELMGEMVNSRAIQTVGKLIVVVVVGLNGYLLITSLL